MKFPDQFKDGNHCALSSHDAWNMATEELHFVKVKNPRNASATKELNRDYARMTDTGPADAFASHPDSYIVIPEKQRREEKEYAPGFGYNQMRDKKVATLTMGRKGDLEERDDAEKAIHKRIGFHSNSLAHETTHYLDRDLPIIHGEPRSTKDLFSELPAFHAAMHIASRANKELGKKWDMILSSRGYGDAEEYERNREKFAVQGEILYGDAKNAPLAAPLVKRFYDEVVGAAIQIELSDKPIEEKETLRRRLADLVNEKTADKSGAMMDRCETIGRGPQEHRPAALAMLSDELSTLLRETGAQARQELGLSSSSPALEAHTVDAPPPGGRQPHSRPMQR